MNLNELERIGLETGCPALGGTVCSLPAERFSRGECASDLIEEAFSRADAVEIPHLPFPVILDRPILLSSGKRLSVHPETVMYLPENCGGCMVRNKNVLTGRHGPMDLSNPDRNILVEGGIWEQHGGGISPKDSSPAMEDCRNNILGVIYFNNAEHFTVRNLTVRRSRFYGILVTGVKHFVIEDIFYDHHGKDGVHVNGPSSYGLIHRMRGNTGDDFVALNAWDWHGSAVSFGEIHHMYIEDLDCEGDELRLLPGRKTYEDGSQVECPIHDCLYRRIHNAYCVKLYQQPYWLNDLYGLDDKSDIAGEIRNIWFTDVGLDALTAEGFGDIEVGALFEICADCSDILCENIRVGVDRESFRRAGLRLCEVGTKSSAYHYQSDGLDKWIELFDTDLVCTAENLTFRNITFAGETCTDRDTIVGAHSLTPNPDYPHTVPKGGTGKGILGNVTIE